MSASIHHFHPNGLTTHSGDKGLIRPETCTVCDPVNYVTFTDFCRAVHETKPRRS